MYLQAGPLFSTVLTKQTLADIDKRSATFTMSSLAFTPFIKRLNHRKWFLKHKISLKDQLLSLANVFYAITCHKNPPESLMKLVGNNLDPLLGNTPMNFLWKKGGWPIRRREGGCDVAVSLVQCNRETLIGLAENRHVLKVKTAQFIHKDFCFDFISSDMSGIPC